MQVERRPIRVMLVEDHNLVRAGIRAVIDGQSDIQVIAEATEGREAVRLARANCPDVAVVDVAMPGMSGIEVVRALRVRQRRPTAAVPAAAGAQRVAEAIDSAPLPDQVKDTASGAAFNVWAAADNLGQPLSDTGSAHGGEAKAES